MSGSKPPHVEALSMRTYPGRRPALVALSVLAFLVAGARARAEGPEAQSPACWRFDVRVVRVSTESATIEQAPRLPATSPAGLSTAPWPDLLAAFKARGTAQILLDRSTTGVSGSEAYVEQRETGTAIVVKRSDGNGASSESMPFSTGATVRLVARAETARTDAGTLLTYKVSVDWLKAAQASGAPVVVATTWQGDLLQAGGGTLVLRHAEQGLEPASGTEIYVLISWASS